MANTGVDDQEWTYLNSYELLGSEFQANLLILNEDKEIWLKQ